MPKGFDKCVAGGGRVRTRTGPNKEAGLKEGEYRRICFDSDGAHQGHVKRSAKADTVDKAKRKK